ncbi:alpha/beta hydrolase [Lysobacter arvi]|uniref:Alpha/beta fold hydrolase n=1 Tax=Lysobacter arvi TaxID=3038776 RepID=A0ABU1CGW1_9GAMM|nr:alpha/beta fold hydrolase [Lysobacter arvi]MDR0184201.1 alpha/beta fold hydrolase [Lysobacter arvi]
MALPEDENRVHPGADENDDEPAHAQGLTHLIRRSIGGLGTFARRLLLGVLLLAVALVGIRAYLSTQGPPLRPWQTLVPGEADADAIANMGWADYVKAEAAMFDDVHRRLRAKLEPADRTPLNRYHDESLASPLRFERDWNRSFVLEPEGEPRGVAVMLHGLTDSPYSMRSLAQLYAAHGYVALVPRLPGHGTVPAGLTREGRKEWNAVVDLAMREAQRRAGPDRPIHLVGYSNGAALALLHQLRRIERDQPSDVERIVLLSPMIEVNRFARYAGLAGVPAFFTRYAKSAWLDLLPEYNPFKYNSFPVRAARESYLVTADLQRALEAVSRQQRMDRLPPVLAFQSVVDDTVSARAVMQRLFDALPDNGSELELFDVNRSRVLAPMLRPAATQWTNEILQRPRDYTLTVLGVASQDDASVLARSRAAHAGAIAAQPIGLAYPAEVYSLSHVALPFADDDPLYGLHPKGTGGLRLGAVAVRGERNGLLVSQDALSRLGSNPFHAYMLSRIAGTIEPDDR